ncbi:MAG: hypothetical protein LUC43_07815 [Burkholderiales bacterium]|nr:hypothetical protein [Burkholderiales bacterium]
MSMIKFALAASTALALAAGTAVAAQEPAKPILGVVTPNQTTLTEAKANLKAKSCQFKAIKEVVGRSAIEVSSDCFQLPGNPTVVIAGRTAAPVELITIRLNKLPDPAIYGRYENSLKNTYGKPGLIGFVDSTTSFLAWRPGPEFIVTLVRKAESKALIVGYNFGKDVNETWSQFEKNSTNAPAKDLDAL